MVGQRDIQRLLLLLSYSKAVVLLLLLLCALPVGYSKRVEYLP